MHSVVLLVTLSLVIAAATWCVYAISLHPLRRFPGPRPWAVTQLPSHLDNMAGRLAFRLHGLHQTYGPVVRVGPNELSFTATSIDTWGAIHARRPTEMPKFLGGTGLHPPYNGVAGIEASDHQERLIAGYVEKLLQILRRSDGEHDFARLLNWMAFDIVGDLARGESFGGLDEQRYHSWVGTVFAGIKAIAFLQFVLFYRLGGFLRMITPQRLAEQRDEFYALAFEKTDARLARQEDRSDFVSFMEVERDGSAVMSTKEMHTTFSTLLVAGSESSATHLSGTLYLCLTHPLVYKRLRGEVRAAFSRKEDVTRQSAKALEYMGCVMQESFRLYPPAPATIPRVVPAPGEPIDGRWVPGGTVVGINQWSTYHSALNFAEPECFDPDRWMPDSRRPSKYAEDHRDVLQPFSYGPRDCIGKQLAYAEIRLTLCHLLLEFDLELCKQATGDWMEQLQFLTWEKSRPSSERHDDADQCSSTAFGQDRSGCSETIEQGGGPTARLEFPHIITTSSSARAIWVSLSAGGVRGESARPNGPA